MVWLLLFNNGVNLHQLKTYEEPKGNKKPILNSNVKSKAKMPRECKLIHLKQYLDEGSSASRSSFNNKLSSVHDNTIHTDESTFFLKSPKLAWFDRTPRQDTSTSNLTNKRHFTSQANLLTRSSCNSKVRKIVVLRK